MKIPFAAFTLMFCAVLLASLAAGTAAQTAPQNSLASLPAGEKFTSVEGGFTISLPKNSTFYSAVKAANEKGGEFGWRLTEGAVTVRYADNSNPAFVFRKKSDYKSFFVGLRTGILKELDAKTSSEGFIKLGEYQGYQFKFDTANNAPGQVRIFVVGKRYYTLTGYANKDVPGAGEQISRAFDSFALSAPADPQK